jgi:hypothetical protein
MFPEPDGVYGPQGRRFVRGGRAAAAATPAPVTARVAAKPARQREEQETAAMRSVQGVREYAE